MRSTEIPICLPTIDPDSEGEPRLRSLVAQFSRMIEYRFMSYQGDDPGFEPV